jgi:hypothetical protein
MKNEFVVKVEESTENQSQSFEMIFNNKPIFRQDNQLFGVFSKSDIHKMIGCIYPIMVAITRDLSEPKKLEVPAEPEMTSTEDLKKIGFLVNHLNQCLAEAADSVKANMDVNGLEGDDALIYFEAEYKAYHSILLDYDPPYAREFDADFFAELRLYMGNKTQEDKEAELNGVKVDGDVMAEVEKDLVKLGIANGFKRIVVDDEFKVAGKGELMGCLGKFVADLPEFENGMFYIEGNVTERVVKKD